MVRNELEKETCPCCETPKPGSKPSQAPSKPPEPAFQAQKFAAPSEGGFSFGIPKTDSTPKIPSFGIPSQPPKDDSAPKIPTFETKNLFEQPKTDGPAPKIPTFGNSPFTSNIFGKPAEKTDSVPAIPKLGAPSSTSTPFLSFKPADSDGPAPKMQNLGTEKPNIFEQPKATPAFGSTTQLIFGQQKSDAPPSLPKLGDATSNIFGPAKTNGSSGKPESGKII
jgi:hypothetical protein